MARQHDRGAAVSDYVITVPDCNCRVGKSFPGEAGLCGPFPLYTVRPADAAAWFLREREWEEAIHRFTYYGIHLNGHHVIGVGSHSDTTGKGGT